MTTAQNDVVLDQFTKQAEGYAALLLSIEKDPTLGWLMETVRPGRDDLALDVGCGSGKLASGLATMCGHVTGIDLTPAMLEQAEALQKTSGLENIDWVQGDVSQLPFDDNSFSVVTSSTVFHHLADPAKVFSEMWRVCKSGGRMALIDLAPQADKSAAFDAIEILRDPSHVHALPTEHMRDLGRQLGLAEIGVNHTKTRLPLEAVLATSFPEHGMLDKVRAIYRNDADSGFDALGFEAQIEDGHITVCHPMTRVAWSVEK